jgi:hypothetical protein
MIAVATAFEARAYLILCTVWALIHSPDTHHLFLDDKEAGAWRYREPLYDQLPVEMITLCNKCLFVYQLFDLAIPDATNCSARASDKY